MTIIWTVGLLIWYLEHHEHHKHHKNEENKSTKNATNNKIKLNKIDNYKKTIMASIENNKTPNFDDGWWWWVSAQALPSRFEVMGPLFICRGAAPVAPLTAAPAGTATATTAPAHWCDLLKSKCQGKISWSHKENGVQSSIRGFEMAGLDWTTEMISQNQTGRQCGWTILRNCHRG